MVRNNIDRTAYDLPMNLPEDSHRSRSVTLSLPPEEHWTLHHMLLDRIEQEATAEDSTSVDPPPVEVFQAFELLDTGETTFTIAQLEAIQRTLAEYHHSTTWWEIERSRLEQLLHRVSKLLKRHQRRSSLNDR